MQLTPNFVFSGCGEVEVRRNGVPHTTVPFNNLVLSNFHGYLLSKTKHETISACVKLGSGNTPSTVDMTTIETPLALTQGSWIATPPLQGHLGRLSEGGATLSASCDFTFTHAAGQVIGTLQEFGLDFFLNRTPSDTTVQTRVVLDAPVELLAADQLIVRYKVTLKAAADQPAYNLSVDNDGTPSLHEVKMHWGPLARFIDYLNPGGYIDDGSDGYRITVLSAYQRPQFQEQWMTNPVYGDRMNWLSENGLHVLKVNLATEQGNTQTGIRCLMPENGNSWWRYSIEPPIAKTALNTFDIWIARPLGGIVPPPVPPVTPDPPPVTNPVTFVDFNTGMVSYYNWDWVYSPYEPLEVILNASQRTISITGSSPLVENVFATGGDANASFEFMLDEVTQEGSNHVEISHPLNVWTPMTDTSAIIFSPTGELPARKGVQVWVSLREPGNPSVVYRDRIRMRSDEDVGPM